MALTRVSRTGLENRALTALRKIDNRIEKSKTCRLVGAAFTGIAMGNVISLGNYRPSEISVSIFFKSLLWGAALLLGLYRFSFPKSFYVRAGFLASCALMGAVNMEEHPIISTILIASGLTSSLLSGPRLFSGHKAK